MLWAVAVSLVLHLGLLVFVPPIPPPKSHALLMLEARLENTAPPPPLAAPKAQPRPTSRLRPVAHTEALKETPPSAPPPPAIIQPPPETPVPVQPPPQLFTIPSEMPVMMAQPVSEIPATVQPPPETPAPVQPPPETPVMAQPLPVMPVALQQPAETPAPEAPVPVQPEPEIPPAVQQPEEAPAPEAWVATQPEPETPAAVQPPPEAPTPVQPEPEKPLPVQPPPETPAPVQPKPVQPKPEAPAKVQPPPPVEPVAPKPVQAPPAPARTTLPVRAELRYDLFKGTNGLNVGRAVQRWKRTGDTYSLSSVAEATGLFSLFYSGQHTQLSQGKITASGLQPDSFSMQRGSAEKKDAARFDWAGKTLHLNSEGQESSAKLPPGTLDMLSFAYQFAFSLPESGDIRIELTNGRKLDSYSYRIVAEESLETPLGKLKTLHLTKLHAPGEDGTEIWLGMDYHYLPVKIQQIDKKGDSAEQVINEIRYE